MLPGMVDFEECHGLTHREAAGRLLAAGWDVCGVGDWAVVWRSPDGSRVARVCAFEPAYEVFVRLCRNLNGHPMLPRIDVDFALAGGGRLTVMEFLLPADGEDAKRVVARWDEAPGRRSGHRGPPRGGAARCRSGRGGPVLGRARPQPRQRDAPGFGRARPRRPVLR